MFFVIIEIYLLWKMWPLHFRKTVETQVDPRLTVMRLFKAYARRTTIDIGRASRYSWISKTWAHNSSWKQEWVEPKSVCNHTTFNHEYDRIRRYEVLLPIINHNYNKIFDILGYFFFASSEKNPFEWWHVLSNYLAMTPTVPLHCPISAKGQLMANRIWEFCYSYD